MAQRDIQDVARYMRLLDESKAAEDLACEDACKECEEQQALEYEEIDDDEVIDKKSMGFIDDCDLQQDESDDFYDEDDSGLEEDVSDCVEQEAVDAPDNGIIEVEVYNEDGYGKFFTKELMKQVQGVIANVKKTLPNGDLLVKISGPVDKLEDAFAFYVGKPDYDVLPAEDKQEFLQRLVLDTGDTYAEALAEADYREAVAHCLDPVGVHASTASLADQDTCAISMIKEEKARRSAKRMLKALSENDFSSLSDDDIEKLDAIKDANGDTYKMSPDHAAVWKQILKDMGHTEQSWSKLTPEQQEKAWNDMVAKERQVKSRTGFAHYRPGEHPLTYEITDKDGLRYVTTWNPDYSQEDSVLQHPAMLDRMEKARTQAEDQARRDKASKDAIKSVRGRNGKEWTNDIFMAMISNLTDKQKKQMMNAMIDEIKAEVPDSKEAAKEIQVIKNMFGKKQTLRDYAAAWGTSFPAVKFFTDRVEGALYQAAAKATGLPRIKALQHVIHTDDKATLQKFADAFEDVMNDVKGRGDQTIDPERAARKAKARAAASAQA